MTPESENIQRIKKLESILEDIHKMSLNNAYECRIKGDMPNEKRFGFIAKKCLVGLIKKEKP